MDDGEIGDMLMGEQNALQMVARLGERAKTVLRARIVETREEIVGDEGRGFGAHRAKSKEIPPDVNGFWKTGLQPRKKTSACRQSRHSFGPSPQYSWRHKA